MADDIKKLLTLDNLAHFKELLALVAITNNYADLDGKPLWVGTKAEYKAQKDDIPDNTLIGIIEEDGSVVKIVSWADGTDAEIKAMIEAAKAGKINLSDYWNIGDERVIHHSAMAATGVDESHAEQDQTWVIMDTGENSGYVFEDDTPVHFVVGMKDCLNEEGYMNSTNTNAGSWDGCARRTWCNTTFRTAIPASIRDIFRQFKTVTASGNSSDILKTSIDYFALFAEKEVFGINSYSRPAEATALKQIKYYETSANLKKKVNGTTAFWWERSPASDNSESFCNVSIYGGVSLNNANTTRALSPFGCI